MKIYIVTTGLIFGIVTVAHIARMITEDGRFATNPFYLAITALSAGLFVWAISLLRRRPRE